MSDEKNLILVMIATGKTPLSAYTPFTGESLQICEAFLSKVVPNSSSAVNFGSYIIYYVNEENITYLIMTMPEYPKPTAIGCIESIKKEVKDIVYNINLDEQTDYGLDGQLKEKLKMKYEFFNENTEVSSEIVNNLKNEMIKMRNEVYEASGLLNERNDIVNTTNDKAQSLFQDSESHKKRAVKVKKTEKKKKILVIIGIIIAILVILYFIVCMVCQSFTFDCSSD